MEIKLVMEILNLIKEAQDMSELDIAIRDIKLETFGCELVVVKDDKFLKLNPFDKWFYPTSDKYFELLEKELINLGYSQIGGFLKVGTRFQLLTNLQKGTITGRDDSLQIEDIEDEGDFGYVHYFAKMANGEITKIRRSEFKIIE